MTAKQLNNLRERVSFIVGLEITTAYIRSDLGLPAISDRKEHYKAADEILKLLKGKLK